MVLLLRFGGIMATAHELANIIFPDITDTIDDLEKQFPPRKLKTGAMVTRFAPSPTGFLHTGSLFTSLIARKVASDSQGVFFTRLEDTDSKREIVGAGNLLLKELKAFGIEPDEGYLGDQQCGDYGPYVQSQRANIYKIVIKSMIERDLAYPCFCTPEELSEMRNRQEQSKVIPGYYGPYAHCRFIPQEEALERIKNNEPYVIRFKSPGNHNHKIKVIDLIRGKMELTENDQDIIIMKSDGLPTYHFAHIVDDHFMRTNCVTRGEEWLSSLPIHIQLFESLGWEAPGYAHLPVINKLDNGNKRKLSKRKDPEAAVSFFIEKGYPLEAVNTYLLSIANSNFEEWWAQNKSQSLDQFKFSFSKMSLDGALFDLDKVNYFAKEILGLLDAETISNRALIWAKSYDADFASLIESNFVYFVSIMGIERGIAKPRKDYSTFSDIYPAIKFFYRPFYIELTNSELPFNPNIESLVIKESLNDVLKATDFSLDEHDWFESLKQIASRHQFAPSGKLYKANPADYVGNIGDFAEILRVALTGSRQSPNLYYIIQVLGPEEFAFRIKYVIEKL